MLAEMIPTRYTIAMMIYITVMVSYTMRVNLSVIIVEMVPVVTNGTQSEVKESLGWSAYERATVLGGYSWGFIVSNMLGGLVVQKLGSRNIVILCQLGSSILTLFSPYFARVSFISLTIIRIALGFLNGFIFPAIIGLIADWAVPHEKGKFTSLVPGGTIGTVIAWATLGVLIESYGWEWGFYSFGIVGVIFCLPWAYIVYDTPYNHPRIREAEKQYIIDRIPKNYGSKPLPPYLRIITNVPCLAGIILAFGNSWGIYFIQNAAPIFIANVLQYKLGATGLVSSLTYVMRSLAALLFGCIGDFLLSRNIMSVNTLRKSVLIFSHILPGLLLLTLTTTADPVLAVVLMTTSIGLNGSIVLVVVNCHDLTPNFAPAVYGLSTGIGAISGILTPLVVAHFTKEDETSLDSWKPIFYIGSGIYLLSAAVFALFGSTKVQAFNELKQTVYLEENTAKEIEK